MEKYRFCRRDFMKQSVAAGIGTLLAEKKLHAQQREKRKKSVLITWGGWEGHEPKKCVDIFTPWLQNQGFQVDVSTNLDLYLDADKMRAQDLIVQAFTMSEITGDQERGLLDAV